MRISKTFDFDAAHWLPMVAEDHKCRRMHGHTYRVEIILEGPIRYDGMVIDYAEIAEAWAPIHNSLDHRTLNDIPGLENPTTEVLSEWILARAFASLGGIVSAVRVYESSTTYAEAVRDGM